MIIPIHKRPFAPELKFSASRSSGAGGQHVNKVSTRVELRFSIKESDCLNDNEKLLLLEKLSNRINSEGELILISQAERSQLRNKQAVIEKFFDVIANALKPRRQRIATIATRSSRLKRADNKRKLSEKKILRRKIT